MGKALSLVPYKHSPLLISQRWVLKYHAFHKYQVKWRIKNGACDWLFRNKQKREKIKMVLYSPSLICLSKEWQTDRFPIVLRIGISWQAWYTLVLGCWTIIIFMWRCRAFGNRRLGLKIVQETISRYDVYYFLSNRREYTIKWVFNITSLEAPLPLFPKILLWSLRILRETNVWGRKICICPNWHFA